MPKKPRQAHIPQQIVRRRRARRGPNEAIAVNEAPDFADEPVFISPGASAPVSTPAPTRRRLDLLRQSQEGAPVRVVPGQLPTFERAFLVSELRRIGLTASVLLALIIALTFILR